MEDIKCGKCGKRMIERRVKYKGLTLKSSFCPPCNYDVFTENQFDDAFIKIQQNRLQDDYVKKTIRIGNSIGITFPQEIVEAFRLEKKRVKLTPDVRSGVIRLKIET